jgi:hypothetical protein
VHRDELGKRITELHWNRKEKGSHQKRHGGGVTVSDPLIAAAGVCDQWDSIDREFT